MSKTIHHAIIVTDDAKHPGLDNLNLLFLRGGKAVLASALASSGNDNAAFNPSCLVIVEIDPDMHPELGLAMDQDAPKLAAHQESLQAVRDRAKEKAKARKPNPR